jgi:hypothetical protein
MISFVEIAVINSLKRIDFVAIAATAENNFEGISTDNS